MSEEIIVRKEEQFALTISYQMFDVGVYPIHEFIASKIIILDYPENRAEKKQ